jgi:hypothetical protein
MKPPAALRSICIVLLVVLVLFAWIAARTAPPVRSAPLSAAPQATAPALDLRRIPNTQAKNVIFILVDDLRHDAFGFAGHPWLETPNLDALARGGVRLRNAFVTTALCSPSRASILTGHYAHRHRVVDNNNPGSTSTARACRSAATSPTSSPTTPSSG